MNDHYHYASEVQGAAEENHSHTPREIGAAEDHDLDMLKRDVSSLESDNRQLQWKVQLLEGRAGTLENQVESWMEAHGRLQDQLGKLVDTVAANAAARQGR